ncbi:hypothetical protein PMIN06_009497 [Paraphaeosphaeria minitans]
MSTVTLTAQQLDEKPPVDIAMLSNQDKEELVTADTVSVVSATINDGIKPAFTPAKSHHIHSKGIPFCACPLRRPNSSHSSKSLMQHRITVNARAAQLWQPLTD